MKINYGNIEKCFVSADICVIKATEGEVKNEKNSRAGSVQSRFVTCYFPIGWFIGSVPVFRIIWNTQRFGTVQQYKPETWPRQSAPLNKNANRALRRGVNSRVLRFIYSHCKLYTTNEPQLINGIVMRII